MIISNSHRFIFVHIQKCAGSTITHALRDTVQWNDIEIGVSTHGIAIQNTYKKKFGLWKHSSAAEILNTIGEETFSSYFKFGFVRNPFYRTVSFYTWIKQMHITCPAERRSAMMEWPISQALTESGSFSEFIRHPGFHEERAMHQLLTDETENHTLLVDFVGKVENLNADLQIICERIGIPHVEDTPRKNISNEDPIKLGDYYANVEDLEFIHELYLRDFKFFGYSLDEAARDLHGQ